MTPDPSLGEWLPPMIFLGVAAAAGLGLGILLNKMRER